MDDENLDFEKLEKIYFPMEKECQARKIFDLIINGNTSYPSQPILNDDDQNGIKLYFDNSYLDNASNLSVALTAAHEFVHIYFGYLYIKGELLTTYPNYIGINKAFANFYDDQNTANGEALDNAMHNVYDDFLDEITDSVFNYATNNNITGVTKDYCKKMVLGAHQDTNTFQSLTSEQQTEYSTIIASENDSKAKAKGTKCE